MYDYVKLGCDQHSPSSISDSSSFPISGSAFATATNPLFLLYKPVPDTHGNVHPMLI